MDHSPLFSFGHMQILNGLLLDHLEEILIYQDVPFPQGDRLYREAIHQCALFPANHMESKKKNLDLVTPRRIKMETERKAHPL